MAKIIFCEVTVALTSYHQKSYQFIIESNFVFGSRFNEITFRGSLDRSFMRNGTDLVTDVRSWWSWMLNTKFCSLHPWVRVDVWQNSLKPLLGCTINFIKTAILPTAIFILQRGEISVQIPLWLKNIINKNIFVWYRSLQKSYPNYSNVFQFKLE